MTEAYLQHGPWGGPYQTERVEFKVTDRPRSGQTATGYGKKIPTSYMVQYNGRWLRVYITIFSNSGTLWAIVNGVKTVINMS